MRCAAARRDAARRAARRLEDLSPTVATDVLDADTDPLNQWTVEIVCDTPHVPPQALATLAECDCALADVSRQGEATYAVATARP